VGSTLSILVAGNLGYIASHVFALTGFLLLRKDRPNWPRPIKLSTIWLPIAALLACANLVFIIVGNMYPELTGYGSLKTTLIGVGVLAISVVAYVVRKMQDKQPLQWRDTTPDVPPSDAVAAVAGGAGS
jgi:amino acid transporter